MKKYYLLFISFLLLSLSGCDSTTTVESSKVSSTEIFQNYSITASKDKTDVFVTFRVGGSSGSTVDLDAPAKVMHNGKEMTERQPTLLKGTDYSDSANELVATHKFIYTDAKGKTWQNEIAVQGLEITSAGSSISKAKGGKIALARSVGKDEEIEITITSDQTQPSVSKRKTKKRLPEKVYSTTLPVKFDATRSTVTIAPLSLKNFADGSAKIRLTLRKTKAIQQSAKGGAISFSYQSEQVSVSVIN